MNALELIQTIEAGGVLIRTNGADIMIAPKEAIDAVREELIQHKEELIRLLLERDLDALRARVRAWYDYRARLNGPEFALRLPPTWSTNVATLYRDFVQWLLNRHQAPPTREQFRQLLVELQCVFRTLGIDEFVDYIALRDDLEAHEKFQREPLPDPSPKPLPEPPQRPVVPTVSLPTGVVLPADIQLPDRVKLIKWEPKEVPVRLNAWTEIKDPVEFIKTTLRELDHYLHGRLWLSGHWGPADAYKDRLRAVGVVIEIDDLPRPNKGGAK